MTRRRGNRNFGRMPTMPVSVSGWDLLLYSLNLRETEALGNLKVREYAVKYYRTRFVPEKVLEYFALSCAKY
jgi:hypothetical protein